MKPVILYQKDLEEYDFGEGHPFRGDRVKIILDFLKKYLSAEDYWTTKAKPASDNDLSLICRKDYIDFTKKFFESANLNINYNGRFYLYHSADNFPRKNPGKIEKAGRIIIGQAKLACDLILENRAEKAISLGGGLHHAKKNYGEGFCLYNDVAFAAKYLIEKHNFERILILDTDAHTGNGTMDYFYDSDKVLFIDIHQDPRTLYPGVGLIEETGSEKGKGYTVNCPLLPKTGWASYDYIFEKIIFPLAREFKPQIIIRNGGSDPYFGDTLTQLGLEVGDFRKIGEKVKEMAQISTNNRAIDMIGSGYNLKALGPCWLSLIAGLTGLKTSIKELKTAPAGLREDINYEETKEMVQGLQKILKPYWQCFN